MNQFIVYGGVPPEVVPAVSAEYCPMSITVLDSVSSPAVCKELTVMTALLEYATFPTKSVTCSRSL